MQRKVEKGDRKVEILKKKKSSYNLLLYSQVKKDATCEFR